MPAPTPKISGAAAIAVLATNVEHIREDQTTIKATLSGINESLKVLGRIEERHIAVAGSIKALTADSEKLESRVQVIETEMPQLKEMRGWVIRGVAAGVGMMFVGLVSLVGNGLADRMFPKTFAIYQAPPAISAPAHTAPAQ